MTFLYILEVGLFLGAEIYFITLLSSLPIFLNWKTQKNYYSVLFFIAGVIFITGFILKAKLFSQINFIETFEEKLGASLSNTIFGSVGIILNFYFIKRMDKINHMSASNKVLRSYNIDSPLFITEFKENNPVFVKTYMRLILICRKMTLNSVHYCS